MRVTLALGKSKYASLSFPMNGRRGIKEPVKWIVS